MWVDGASRCVSPHLRRVNVSSFWWGCGDVDDGGGGGPEVVEGGEPTVVINAVERAETRGGKEKWVVGRGGERGKRGLWLVGRGKRVVGRGGGRRL